jgi:amino acid adenylation domain-containing protein
VTALNVSRVAPQPHMKANVHNTAEETRLLQRLYWAERLGEGLPQTTLCAYRERESAPGRRGFEALRFELPGEVSGRLFRLAGNSDLSIYLVLAAALSILLYRYTGDAEVLVGSPAYAPPGGRGAGDRLVPLRLRVRGDDSFKTHLLEIRKHILAAYGNQEYLFESSSRRPASSWAGGNSTAPRVTLSLRNIHGEDVQAADGRELCFSFLARAGTVSGRLCYDADLFDKSAVERLSEHYVNILRGVVRDLNVRADEVLMLTQREEHQCLFGFGRGAEQPAPDGRLAHQLFAEEVKQRPGRIAVTCEARSLTYEGLNALADNLARSLSRHGVAPEVVVPVLAPRGVGLLVSLLALFKAGGAYLPLDPLHPPRRLAQIIRESAAPLLLAGEGLRETVTATLEELPAAARPRVAHIDELLGREQAAEGTRRPHAAGNLAYVIYTSGSTGVPKGAMIEHRGMLNHLRAKIDEFRLDGETVVAQTAPQGFDISIWQLLAALMVGGSVRIASDEVVRDPSLLLEWLERESVTVLEVVPSQLRAMLQTMQMNGGGARRLPALKWLFVTGEALPPELSRQWLSLYPQTPLVNAYGPTECSDDVTHYVIREPPPAACVYTPTGRPIVNTQLYILDRRGRPVPRGVAGEIFVGGRGVGRGYLHDAARTAEVFVPNPFAAEPGARLYRTGDLGFHLPDGNIQFVSRIDHQVKVRGFRVETEEVSATLLKHPSVREAVVVVSGGTHDERRLVAYLVPEDGRAPTTAGLRDFLKSRLPDYMLPSAFVTLERLPQGPNGKLDRRALPAPNGHEPDEGCVPPGTPVEKALAGIWAEALGVGRVGVNDNFFEAGGNSLLAIQVVNRIRASFKVALPLKVLFESPRLGELAARLGGWPPAAGAEEAEREPGRVE